MHTIGRFLYYRCLCGQFRPAPPRIWILGRIIAFLLSTLLVAFYIIGAGRGQKPQGVLALSVDTLDTSPLQGLVFGYRYKQVCLLQISLFRGLLTPVGPGSSLQHNMCGGKGVTLNLKKFLKFLNNSPCHSSSAAIRHVYLNSENNGFIKVGSRFCSYKSIVKNWILTSLRVLRCWGLLLCTYLWR